MPRIDSRAAEACGQHNSPHFGRTRRGATLSMMLLAACTAMLLAMPGAYADDSPTPPPVPLPTDAVEEAADTVEKLTERSRKSIVVITFAGRDGKQQGLGSGFVVAPDGLIATNLHVIGEARPITVQLADGKSYDVTAVEAFDRKLDLALLRIKAGNLSALTLGDSNNLKQGQPVIALGNPHGLKHSVVTGIVSGTREIEGRPMIQLAIPIEPGNSGGPLLDMQGRVHGILTMKSVVTENLGFAVTVNSLKPLIEKPNPTIMSRWLTIGALDPKEWTTRFGSSWRQRAGRIIVDGSGNGFGDRSLCLSERIVPDSPYEIAVSVKLENEDGAAGLVFCADGGDKHYGFYPSKGRLRLTRFDGPDVFSWTVLQEKPIESYRAGDWNTLKVHLEGDKIQCYVNDKLALESSERQLTGMKVGLAKFRNTQAEFKSFKVAKAIPQESFPDEVVARINLLAEKVPVTGALKADLAETLLPDAGAGVVLLRERAKRMEQQAAQLKKLALAVHHRHVQKELVKLLDREEGEIDLFHAALLVAQLDNDEVDVEAFRNILKRMGREVVASMPAGADEKGKLTAMNKYLFEELGFHGSRGDYYNRSNSYVNEVLEDREGLPITLAVLYIELARELGVKVVGLGLPGHFVVRHEPAEGEPQIIDVYERGQKLSREEAEKLIQGQSGDVLKPEHFTTAKKRSIIVRILYNLLGLAQRNQEFEVMLRYVDTIIAINPESGDERWIRAVLRFQLGRREEALEDTEWLFEHKPHGIDLNRVTELRQLLDHPDQ